MEPVQLNYQEAFFWGIVINAGIGFVLGLIPLIIGLVKRNLRYGIFGHVAATVGGAVLGVFLAVPAVIFFTWLILKSPPSMKNSDSSSGSRPLDSNNN